MPLAERRCTAPSGTLTCLVGNKLDGMQAESATWGEKEGGGLKGAGITKPTSVPEDTGCSALLFPASRAWVIRGCFWEAGYMNMNSCKCVLDLLVMAEEYMVENESYR